jgi:hypothetical protein
MKSVLLLPAVLMLASCGSTVAGLSEDGTGVPGLDTPEQILSNPYVDDAIDAARDEGVVVTPEAGVNPPVITGSYQMSGEVMYLGLSGWRPLSPGTWRWSNQTSANHVDTDFEQAGLLTQTGSGGGEIIRGEGSRFTVYSVLDVSTTVFGETCQERVVVLVDGTQLSNGDVTAVYIGTPAQEAECYATSVGRLELSLTGPASSSTKDVADGLLMKVLTDFFPSESEGT